MKKKNNSFIYWTPRILSIIFIVFLVVMSFDVISPELSLRQITTGLFIHNIPTLIMLIVLIISWKHEIAGGFAFLLAGLLYIVFACRAQIAWYIALSWILTIAGPAFLIGVLFLINWFRKRQE